MFNEPPVLFLSWAIPWPPHSGAALRTLGLLKEIGRRFPVTLVTFWRRAPTAEERAHLEPFVRQILWLPMRHTTSRDRARIAAMMVRRRYPYHSALLMASLEREPALLRRIQYYPGVVFASMGHWGTVVADSVAPNWILNQYDADVDLWRVYASHARNPLLRLAALVNWRLAARLYPRVYPNVHTVISVCEEDRRLTQTIAPQANGLVIENGIDADFYTPQREVRTGPPRILFTGTSAPRNLKALHHFTERIWPLALEKLPTVELLVAGNFTASSQREFRKISNIRFTGPVPDIRPFFNISDLYIAPFDDTHGSKLKLVEAMAMSLPIVSTPQGVRGLPEASEGAVVIADNNVEFAKAVLNLLDNPLRAAELGNAGRRIVLETLDWGMLGKRLAELIGSVPVTG